MVLVSRILWTIYWWILQTKNCSYLETGYLEGVGRYSPKLSSSKILKNVKIIRHKFTKFEEVWFLPYFFCFFLSKYTRLITSNKHGSAKSNLWQWSSCVSRTALLGIWGSFSAYSWCHSWVKRRRLSPLNPLFAWYPFFSFPHIPHLCVPFHIVFTIFSCCTFFVRIFDNRKTVKYR